LLKAWTQKAIIFGTTRKRLGNVKGCYLRKPKGKRLENTVYTIISPKTINGQAKALIHWVFIHPRKTWRPLPDEIQEYEIEPEKYDIKASLKPAIANA
jgi:hypothetical protein